MKSPFFALVVLFGSTANLARSQGNDFFLEAGGDRLHFHILKGSGVPILFEAGGGDDGAVWTKIIGPIHDITHATVIAYDRAGFGKSELNTKEQAIDRHGIKHGIAALDEALKKLGYDDKIMLVAHSYGSLYATLYAASHPTLVKAAVLVDGSSACWFTDDWMNTFVKQGQSDKGPRPGQLGNYYQSANLPKTVEIMRNTIFPPEIPVIDLVSENPPFSDSADIARWKDCHRQFVRAESNREGIIAYGCGHYIFQDNPPLVIHAVVKAYIGMVDRQKADEITRRHLDYVIKAVNHHKP